MFNFFGKSTASFPFNKKYIPKSSFLFDGSDDFIDFDLINLPIGDSSRSISYWVNPQLLSGEKICVGWGVYAANQIFVACNGLSADPNTPTIWGYAHDERGTYNLSTGIWYHIAWTYDSATSTLKSYVNTAIDKNSPTSDYNTQQTNGQFRIGKSPGPGIGHLNGYITDIKIYNRSISENEVKNLYDFKVIKKGLVFWAKCNEDSGSICRDSALGNDGVIYNHTPATFFSSNAP